MIAVPILLILPGLVLVSYGATEYWGAGPEHQTGTIVVTPITCPPAGVSPSSLAIPVSNVPGTIGPGWGLEAAYEFQAVNYSPELAGRTLYFPSTLAVFPTVVGTPEELYFPPHNATIADGDWSAPTPVGAGAVEASNLTFLNSSPAYLSTQRIAVMIQAPNASAEIAVRWHWALVPPGGAPENGSWSVPNASASAHYDPSLLHPAPYAGIVSSNGTAVVAGANWSATLNGSVAGQSFRISLEWKNGTEIYSLFEKAWPLAPTVTLSITTSPPGYGTLPAGPYILHIHNACSAILHTLTVNVTAAPPPALAGAVPSPRAR